MKIKILLISTILFFAFGSTTYAVNSINMTTAEITNNVHQDKASFWTKLGDKTTNLKRFVGKKLAALDLLDKPRKLLIYAAIAFLAALAITILGFVIMISFLSILSWLLYLVSFTCVVLWVYAVLIRR